MNIKVKALLAVLLVLLGVSTASTAFAQESERSLPRAATDPNCPDDVGEAADYPGGGWLGLIPVGNRWTLAPASVRFEPSQPGGDIVDIKSNLGKAVALFRCKWLRQGKVDAANLAFPKDGRAIGRRQPAALRFPRPPIRTASHGIRCGDCRR